MMRQQHITTTTGSSSSTTRKKQSTDDNNDKDRRPPTWKVWVIASRPHTLTASMSPCIVAFGYCYNQYIMLPSLSASAISDDDMKTLLYQYFFIWCLFCMTVQIGTNLHNDYSDYVQGADHKETRVGQLRATAQGWITPYETCCAATITLSITLLTGITLIISTHQINNLWLWLWILSSVFNAFAYTAVATYMLPYLLHCMITHLMADGTNVILSSPFTLPLLMYGIQIGLLATNIIVVNNLRDCATDALANKRTTTVRFGTTFSKVQYCSNYIITYLLVLITPFMIPPPSLEQHLLYFYSWSWLPLLTIFPAYKEVQAIMYKRGADLNPHVGGAAKVQFLFCILLMIRLLVLPL